MKEYQIKDKDGIVIGRFQNKGDRDIALRRFVDYGFPDEVLE